MEIGVLSGRIELEDTASASLATFSSNLTKAGSAMTAAGSTLTLGLTAPLVAAAGASTMFSIQFESAFANVKKTVDATVPQFAQIEQGIRDMAMEMPIAATELARIASVGGQFGIKQQDILDFTRTVAMLGTAIDGIDPDTAAASLAQFASIAGVAGTEFDNLASMLVKLGNEGTSTEGAILELAKRMAVAGTQAGLSASEIFGMAASLANAGIEAESGGTAFSKVFRALNDAAIDGGAKLNEFARVAGMSAQQFATAFKDKPTEAITAFLGGLGQMQSAGQSTTGVFEELELQDSRLIASVGALALTAEKTGATIKSASEEFRTGGALGEEYGKKAATTASQLTVLWNRVQDVGITLGQALVPAMMSALDSIEPLLVGVANLAKWFVELPKPIQTTAIVLGALLAAIGPVLVVVGTLVTSVTTLIPLWPVLGAAITSMTFPLRLLSSQIEIFGVATGVSTTANYLWATSMNAVKGAAAALWAVLVAHPLIAVTAAVGALTLAFVKMAGAANEWKLSQQIAGAQQDSINLAISRGAVQGIKFADAMKFNDEWLRKLQDPLTKVNTRLQELTNNGADAAEKAKALSSTVMDLANKGQLGSVQMKEIAQKTRDLGVSVESLPLPLRNVVIGLDNVAKAGKIVTVQTEAQVKTSKDLQDSMAKNTAEARKLESGFAGLTASVGEMNTAEIELLKNLEKTRLEIDKLEQSAWIASFGFQGMTTGLENLGRKSTELDTVASRLRLVHDIEKVIPAGFEQAGIALENLGQKSTEIDVLRQKIASAGETIRGNLAESLKGIPDLLIKAFTGGGGLIGALKALGVQIAENVLEPIMRGLSAVKQAAVAGAISAATVGVAAIQAGASWQRALGGVALTTGTAMASATLAAGGLTAATIGIGAATMGIGAAAIGVYVLAKHWLSVKQEEKDARAEFELYQKQFGTLDQMIDVVGKAYATMGLTGEQAQRDINTALDATHRTAGEVHSALVTINDVLIAAAEKTAAIQAVDGAFQGLLETVTAVDIGLPEAFRPMIERLVEMPTLTDNVRDGLQGLLDTGAPNFVKLTQMAKGYGIELAALGPAFQQAHVTDEATKIINHFEMLEAAGADVNGVIQGMGDEISAVVQQSMEFGTTIPGNMRPMIEALIASGKLLDANKNQITDIAQLNFGAEVKTDVDRLADSITKLTDAILKIPGALTAINNVQVEPIHVEIVYDDPGYSPDVQTYAKGGVVEPLYAAMGRMIPGPWTPRGTDTVPAMLTPGEGVVTVEGMSRLGNEGLTAINRGIPADNGSEKIEQAIERLNKDWMTRLPGLLATAMKNTKAA